MPFNGLNSSVERELKELKKYPVSISFLLLALSVFMLVADNRHASGEEVKILQNEVQRTKAETIEIKKLILESKITNLDDSIYRIEALIEKGEATERDNTRLLRLRRERDRALSEWDRLFDQQ